MFWDRKKDDQGQQDANKKKTDSTTKAVVEQKLNPELQKLLEKEEEFVDHLYEGSTADSTETNYRYAAYATRIRTILLSAHRYVAYTSDIGESFRPVAHPWLVRSAYGISWAYIAGDVANEGYKAYVRNRRILCPQSEAYRNATSTPQGGEAKGVLKKIPSSDPNDKETMTLYSTVSRAHPMPWNDPDSDTWAPWSTAKIPLSEDYRSVMAERAVFQAVASMGLPAFTIHSVVRYSGRALKDAKNALVRTWTPIGLGLAVVPFLPYVFDKPVEHAVQWTFHNAFLAIGGPDAVPSKESASAAEQAIKSLEERKRLRKEARERRKAEKAD